MPRPGRVIEWARKHLARRTMRLCEWCLKGSRRCQDSTRRGYEKHNSWKDHRGEQWRPKSDTESKP
jgi:hypothetical protein